MPYVDVQLQPAPSPEQANTLAQGITDALADITHKRPEVTSVRIGSPPVQTWTIGGAPCLKTTASLDIKITVNTNTQEEKSALIARLHGLLESTLGDLAEASYIMIHELPAENWGYAGRTQAARAADPA